jgi:nitrate/nitrite transporter NarK
MVPRLTLIYAAGMFGNFTMNSALSLYLGATFGFTERTVGWVFAYQSLFGVVMRSALVGPIVDRIGEPRSMRIGTIILIAGLIGYPLASNLWILACIMPLIPIGTALLYPATTALMSRSAKKNELGATMGVAQTFGGFSRLLAPVTSTTMFQYAGAGSPFFFAAASVGLASLLALNVTPAQQVEPET